MNLYEANTRSDRHASVVNGSRVIYRPRLLASAVQPCETAMFSKIADPTRRAVLSLTE
jgi:hypothetical protein